MPLVCFNKKYFPRSFTLVEIMIVVAIIALLAAIAIPNIMRVWHNADETAAQGTLATIAKAEITYRVVNPQYANLGQLIAAGPPYIDATVGDIGGKQGYIFAMVGIEDGFQFTVGARPVIYQQTGTRTFCVVEDGVIRAADNAGAVPADRITCTGWNVAGN